MAVYLLAFGITWLGWLPQALHSRGFFPIDSQRFYVLGGVGPLIAGHVVLRRERGGDAAGALFAPLLRWRVRSAWYLVARSVIYTWIYNGSAGSVQLVTLFHAASNTVSTFVPAELLASGVLALLIVFWRRSIWLYSGRAPTRVGA